MPNLGRKGTLSHFILSSLLVNVVLVLLKVLIPSPLLVDETVCHIALPVDP